MKKFLLLAFFLLAGVTTTSTYADDAVVSASVDSAVASNEIDTLEWYIVGGPAMIVIRGAAIASDGSGSIQIRGVKESDVHVIAGVGYIMLSSGVYTVGNRIVVYATLTRPM